MNRRAEIFFDAVTLLREDLVEEAQDYHFRKKQSVWKKIGGLAACLCLIASLSLLMLPRGCGGSAPPQAGMNSSGAPPQAADSCAPADTPISGEPMPEPEAPAGHPENGYGQVVSDQFTATVIEVGDNFLVIEILESGNDQVAVSTADLEMPELRAGDLIRVSVSDDWMIAADDPGALSGVISIEKIENNG